MREKYSIISHKLYYKDSILDKGLLVFIAIGIVGIYFITSFVDGIQGSERYQKSGYSSSEDKDMKYQSTNSIGDTVLDVSSVGAKEQIVIWNRSEIKREFLSDFPNFEDMRDFVDDRIVGDRLQQRLKETIDSVEDIFVAGDMSSDRAKRKFNL